MRDIDITVNAEGQVVVSRPSLDGGYEVGKLTTTDDGDVRFRTEAHVEKPESADA